MTKNALILGVGFIFGMCFGVILSLGSLRVQRYVDYDSGAEKDVLKAGPYVLRQTLVQGGEFGRIVMSNGRRGLTDVAGWHLASDFAYFSKVSPTFDGSRVLNSVRQLELLLKGDPTKEEQVVKERFLRTLEMSGSEAAEDYAEQLAQERIKKYREE